MPTKRTATKVDSFAVIRQARKLVDQGKITNKALAIKADIPNATLRLMLSADYENKSISHLDALRVAVWQTMGVKVTSRSRKRG